MNAIRYTPEMAQRWDSFVDTSKNATFLFKRAYMNYHSDRFFDHGLLFEDSKNNLVGIMPANQKNDSLFSHEGLTFGGILSAPSMTTPIMIEVFDALHYYARENEIKFIVYKTIPYIYSQIPAQEDLYALFRHNAVLSRRDVLSVIKQSNRLPFQTRRNRKIKQARKEGLVVKRTENYELFWAMLEKNLLNSHAVAPVHNIAEIKLLASRFPENIKLFCCNDRNTMLAGTVVYLSANVAHIQYMASSEEGKKIGALDLLLAELIENIYASKRYFDFGISTENDGRKLNLGLVDQKEGFGARAIAHDQYRMVVK